MNKTVLNKAIAELKIAISDLYSNIESQLEALAHSLWMFTKTLDRPQESKPPIKAATNRWVKSKRGKGNAFT